MSMPPESLRKLSLNELVTLLHNSLSNLSKGVRALGLKLRLRAKLYIPDQYL